MRPLYCKFHLFFFILFILLFIGMMSCGGGGSGSSADLNLSAQNCGNALINENESCDDGNTNNSDGCNANCAWEVGEAICGNGVLENEECCDDGNTVSGDGCSSACTKEAVNRPPSAPLLATEPANGATWAPTRLYLSWNPSTDADVGDQVVYDVYFVEGNGISPTAFPYKQGLTDTHFIIQASTDNRSEYFPNLVQAIYLEANTQYTWKICARDRLNVSSCSEQRVFKTDDSVVGWWRFDENPNSGIICPGGQAGEAVCDYSGKNNHGVPNGGLTWLPLASSDVGLLNSCLELDGINDYIDIQNNSDLNTSFFSVQFYTIITEERPFPRIIQKRTCNVGCSDVTAGYGFERRQDTRRIRFLVSTGTMQTIDTRDEVLQRIAHQVVGTYNGSSMVLYLDGEMQNQAQLVNPIVLSSDSLQIGAESRAGTGWYNGFIDDVIIYNKALLSVEVTNNYLSIQQD